MYQYPDLTGLDEADRLIASAVQAGAPLPVTEAATTWLTLGWIACRRGRADQAAAYLARVLTEGADLRDLPGLLAWVTTPSLQLAAGIALARGNHPAAAVLLAACDQLGAAMPATAQGLHRSLHDELAKAPRSSALESARRRGEASGCREPPIDPSRR